jgi:hypothetical protein
MKPILSTIALVAALSMPSAWVMAQDLDLDAGANANAGAAGSVTIGDDDASAGANAGVDATVTGSVSGDISGVDDLTAAVEASAAANLDFSAMVDWDIHIVEVSSLEASASGNLDALHAMIEANADSLASLHASLEANAAIAAELKAAGYETTDVVAVVESEADTSLTLYVDDSV